HAVGGGRCVQPFREIRGATPGRSRRNQVHPGQWRLGDAAGFRYGAGFTRLCRGQQRGGNAGHYGRRPANRTLSKGAGRIRFYAAPTAISKIVPRGSLSRTLIAPLNCFTIMEVRYKPRPVPLVLREFSFP